MASSGKSRKTRIAGSVQQGKRLAHAGLVNVGAATLFGAIAAASSPAHAEFDVPTGAPSPLFGAQPCTQKILKKGD